MTAFKVLSVNQSRQLDRLTIEGGFVSGEELMQRAGMQIGMLTAEICRNNGFSKDVLLIAGKGNNGGDVFVAARILHEIGFQPTVLLTTPESTLKGDALLHFQKLKRFPVTIDAVTHRSELEMELHHFQGDVIVDGLLGTGFKPPLTAFYREVIQCLNAFDAYVIAVDTPSGLDGDGVHPPIPEEVVIADTTLSIGSVKQGYLHAHCARFLGRIIPIDIGFPAEVLGQFESELLAFSKESIKKLLPRRRRDAHKGSFGHVLVIGGVPGMGGAVVLAGRGAMRCGSGLVSVFTDSANRSLVHQSQSEFMTVDYSDLVAGKHRDRLRDTLRRYQALVMGPGLGTTDQSASLLQAVLDAREQSLVLDADALNLIAAGKVHLDGDSACPLILTPHPGEAARLLDLSPAEVQNNRPEAARRLRQKFNCLAVLKGANTLVAAGAVLHLHLSGTPAMASGGMGDILSGMIGSFLAQGMAPENATNLAVSLHGLAAENLEYRMGPFGFTASECADEVPRVVHQLGRLGKNS